ncbi:putative TYPE I RESTRICTION ENZYME [Helicobacter pylori Hp H-42]|uniref:TYPE I RESTRICTION ENZYME n=1 Tax=Helicobacter pylori Hp H-42 TaxID=992047 RepID=A0AB33XH86_HELPX|nr:putative TYPE I RESTRICTION ENZYME [Helicobacter pylori Hp H-42]
MDALTTPSNWQKVRLGDIAEIKRGASPRPIENPKWFCANSNVGWVRISDISKNSRFLYKTAQKLSKKGIEKSRFIKQNSLIMSMCATIGKPIITKIDTCIHDGFVVFENPKIDLNYLYYFLCYIEKEWLESGQQGSQVNLNVDLIKNKEVFCPKDLNEQAAITNILSDVDRYLYSLDALILKKESVKKALSFELLSQRKRLKGFNQNWQKVRLVDICEFGNGGAYETLIVENGDFKLISLNSIDIDGNLKNTMKRVNFYDNSLKQDDIVMVLSDVAHGDFLGLCAVIPNNDYVLNQRMGRLRKKNDCINILFLRLYINANQKYFKMQGQGSSQLNLSKKAIEDFEILLPPLNEQAAIANVLSGLDNEIISLKNKNASLKTSKKP